MPPKKRRKKKRRRVSAPRVQVPRICSAQLARLLSNNGEARTGLRLTLGEAVKRLWQHAKASGLQEGREIRCDAEMRRLFGCDRLGMFDVAGALSAHLTGAGSASASSTATSASAASVPVSAASRALVTLSPALTSLLCGSANGSGGGPRELTVSHGEALRLLGKYITRNSLRDASDKRKIHCDAALTELVGKGTFTIFEAKALVARHCTPAADASGTAGDRGTGGVGSMHNAGGGSGGSAPSHRRNAIVESDASDGEEEAEGEEEDSDEEGEDGDEDDEEAEESAAAAAAAEAEAARVQGGVRPVPVPTSAAAEVQASTTHQRQRAPLSAAAAAAGAAAERRAAAAAAVSADGASAKAASTSVTAPSTSAPADPPICPSAAQGSFTRTLGEGGEAPPRKRARRKATVPAEFVCPITQEMMQDPVSTVDGHTYERAAIERWLTRKRTSPLTGSVLPSTTVIPNQCAPWPRRPCASCPAVCCGCQSVLH